MPVWSIVLLIVIAVLIAALVALTIVCLLYTSDAADD